MESTASTIVLIFVLAFLAFFVFRGHRKGFLRAALTTFSFVIVIALSTAFTTPVSNFLENTFVGNKVENSVSNFVESKVEDFIGEDGGSISESEEDTFLESLPLPSFIQNNLKTSNTLEEYAQLQVKSFEEYTTAKFTEIIISAIAYVLVMIIAWILIRLILKFAGFINKIPIIGGLNRFLGALLGFLEGLLILWALGLVIIAFSSTSFGSAAVETIQSNALLDFIFDNNLLVVMFGMLF